MSATIVDVQYSADILLALELITFIVAPFSALACLGYILAFGLVPKVFVFDVLS